VETVHMATPDHTRAVETRRAALWSVASNTTLTTLKLLVGLATHSISVLSEAVHSGNDLVAALLAFFSVRKASEPADERHGYGHGKYEALSGAVEAGLILCAALVILYSAVRSLWTGHYEDIRHGPALLTMGLSTVLNIIVSRHLFRVARRHESLALRADAANLSADVWTSAGVLGGLAIMWGLQRLGHSAPWIDPACAALVAVLVMRQGWRVAALAKDQLVDQALPPEELAHIRDIIRDHHGRFVGFHQLRSRRAGHERHIDLHLVVCAEMTVEDAHDLTDHLEEEIEARYPRSQVLIHVEPCADVECRVLRENGQWVLCEQQRKRDEAQAAESAEVAFRS
jgi:cation diffusion facilitator family transporter